MFGFGRKWVKAEGIIITSRPITTSAVDEASARWAYVVEVRPVGGAPFRAEVRTPFWNAAWDTIVHPEDGVTVGVVFDPKSGKVRFDKSDPRLSEKERDRARKADEERRFKEKMKG